MLKARLLTRMEVIESWLKSDLYLNYYCCPFCRDILNKLNDEIYSCKNNNCDLYGKKIKRVE